MRNDKGQFIKKSNRFETIGEITKLFHGDEVIFCDTADLPKLLQIKWSISRVGVCKHAK